MRRLEKPPEKSVYDRGRTSPVRAFRVEREDVERLLKERPELVLSEETGVMLLDLRGTSARLSYGFSSTDALRRRFRPMLEQLAASLRADQAMSGIFLSLTDLPNRPYIEPVLADCLFEFRFEWMEMTLAEVPDQPAPSDDIAPGFVLRPIAESEYETVAAVESAAFADPVRQPAGFVATAQRSTEMRVLEERRSKRVVGYVGLVVERGVGGIGPLAVHPDFQRRGLGEAMLRWALSWFHGRGLRRAKLGVRADNTTAIALYRKLGFAVGQRGLSYRRPTDEKELAAMAEKRKGTFIKFGGWR